MPSVDVTEIVLSDEAKELEFAYKNDPKVRAAIDQFDNECRLRRELAEARRQENMTQVQLSELTGLTQQIISRIETNTEISPSLKNLMIYVNAIGYELTLKPKHD